MSSRKASSFNCESVIRNIVGLFTQPAFRSKFCIGRLKISFYRSFNTIFWDCWRTASEEVIAELMKKKIMSSNFFYYAIELCPLNKAHTNSLDFAVGSCFSKYFVSKYVKQLHSVCSYLTVSLLSTLVMRKDGTILYRNILRLETDLVNCSYKCLLNVGISLCTCVENAVKD